ncbi:MAG: ribonuclease Y [Planctomycetes bacterium]|nr:ribonuclease Y [Planctomycetota bacterium]MBU2596474.1 ribonuclease Y [Planctomycetota bacterium]
MFTLAQAGIDITAIIAIASAIVGAILAIVISKIISTIKTNNLKQSLQSQIENAKKEAENIIKTARLEATAETLKKKEEITTEINQAKSELREAERRLTKHEDAIDRQNELLVQREKALQQSENNLKNRTHQTDEREKEIGNIIAQQKNQLLKISAMSAEDAKQLLLKKLEDECEHEMNSIIQRKMEEMNEAAEEKSREIISSAIQRYAADQTCEVTVSTIDIPSDDMKGRIIGREGRNIRSFEKATGVDVIVDDTPGVIVISGFNPIRREVARQSMEKLIQDGRIHPSRIEELVAQTKKDVIQKVMQVGKEASVEVDVRGLNNKILMEIGTLNYRTSYGQNVLRHSVEVAFLAQVMADELGLDGSIARRAGFLHDIGKAMDHEIEGGHPEIGANYLKRFNESSIILNAVAAHHGDIPADNPYTPLVAAADAISASRPGARRETLERYIKRLEKLEEIANQFTGVENCYAIQAGREIRVIVNAQNIDDDIATKMARDIAKKIEDELTYPGEIKVTLLREVRCIEYAR